MAFEGFGQKASRAALMAMGIGYVGMLATTTNDRGVSALSSVRIWCSMVYDYNKKMFVHQREMFRETITCNPKFSRFSQRFTTDVIHEPSDLEMLPLDDGLRHVAGFIDRHKDKWQVESSSIPRTSTDLEILSNINTSQLAKHDEDLEMFSNTDLGTIKPMMRLLRLKENYNGDVRVMRLVGLFPRVTPDEVCHYLCDVDKRLMWDTNYRAFESLVDLPPRAPGSFDETAQRQRQQQLQSPHKSGGSGRESEGTSVGSGGSALHQYLAQCLSADSVADYEDVSQDTDISQYPGATKAGSGSGGGGVASLFKRKSETRAEAEQLLSTVDGKKRLSHQLLAMADVANEGIASVRASRWIGPVAYDGDQCCAHGSSEFRPIERKWLFHRVANPIMEHLGLKPRHFLYERLITKAECRVTPDLRGQGVGTVGEQLDLDPSVRSSSAFSIQYRSLPPLTAFIHRHTTSAEQDRTDDAHRGSADGPDASSSPSGVASSSPTTTTTQHHRDSFKDDQLSGALSEVCLTILKRVFDIGRDCPVHMHYQEVLLLPVNGKSRLDALAKVAAMQVAGGAYDDGSDLARRGTSLEELRSSYHFVAPTYFFRPDDFAVIVSDDGKERYTLDSLRAAMDAARAKGKEPPVASFCLIKSLEPGLQKAPMKNPPFWTKPLAANERHFIAPNPAAQPLLDELSVLYRNEESDIIRSITMLSQASAFYSDGEYNSHGTVMVMTSVNDAQVPASLPKYVQKQLSKHFTQQAYAMLLHGIGRDRQRMKERKYFQRRREMKTAGLSKDELANLNAAVEAEIIRRQQKAALDRIRGVD